MNIFSKIAAGLKKTKDSMMGKLEALMNSFTKIDEEFFEELEELLETDKKFLYNYLGFLSGRICYLNQKIRYLTAGSAERKLALYLSSFGEETVELDASLSSLSELLDIGRASLYRAFDTLIADGYIQKDGRTIHLLDVDAMIQNYQ